MNVHRTRAGRSVAEVLQDAKTGARPGSDPAADESDPDQVKLSRGARTGIGCAIAAIIGVLLLILAFIVSKPLADFAWFDSESYGNVFVTRFVYTWSLLCGGAVLVTVFLGLNIKLAEHWLKAPPPPEPEENAPAAKANRSDDFSHGYGSYGYGSSYSGSSMNADEAVSLLRELPTRALRWSTVLGVEVLALAFGAALSGNWQTLALWAHQDTSLGSALDPIFGQSQSWWLFSLPLLHLIVGAALVLSFLGLVVTGIAYAALATRREVTVLPRQAGIHLAGLGLLFLVIIAAAQIVGRFDLAFGQNGAVPGVTATDAAIRLPLALITAAFSVGLGLALFFMAWRRTRRAMGAAAGLGVCYVILLVAGFIGPALYQGLSVGPNENQVEAPYIANNIAATRAAFGLDAWSVQSYVGKTGLTSADVSADQATFDNARLWDYRPLGATLDQLQTVRQYFDFTDVDIDRYVLNGSQQQVMLSAREMALDKGQANPSWLNAHILYTHGYGLAMVPVAAVGPGGLPQLIIKDLPVASTGGAPAVTEPQIYFGERDSGWVITGARSDEFDYPATGAGAVNDATTRYAGNDGISLGSLSSRLFWGFRLFDLNLLVSDQITGDSRLLLHRSLSDRLGTLAPFLSFDKDPYLVVTPEGRLVWVQDAFTTSDNMPASTSFDGGSLGNVSGLDGQRFNYIRNSVKITVDAYDGTMHLYVNDPADPLIAAWQGVFPGMFKPLSAMPAGIVAHLRTPEELFNVQTRVYARYHVTDVAPFYKKDDMWTVPQVVEGNDQVLSPEAYYVLVRLPGERTPEFTLIQPMVPAARPNMIAWLAARNDGPNRGQVEVFRLPSDTNIYGPTQIEARIDQDPRISAQISLWNQSGSKVIRGNLLVIPVGTGFVYLEPLYLQSTSSAFPELTKVVLATSDKVGWGDDLKGALTDLLGSTPSGGGGGTVNGLPTDVQGLVQYINDHFEAYKLAQGQGDFVTAGQELQKVQDALNALDALTGVTSPTASPVPSPTASPAP